MGGISVIAWGRVRTTDDIDVIVDHQRLEYQGFIDYLKANNFSADISDLDGFKNKRFCTFFYKDGLQGIDIIGLYTKDNEISILEARKAKFYGINIRIDCPESLIAHKLLWGSQQDIEDAYAIIVRQSGSIDHEKLRSHAERLRISKKLDGLIKWHKTYLEKKKKGETQQF